MRKLKLEELGRISPEEYREIQKIPIIVVLDNIRSAMNVGSFFRTADAFKIQKLILAGITARPPHKEILKTAIGAANTVEWSYSDDLCTSMAELREAGFNIIGIEQTDVSMPISKYPIHADSRYALIFGNEVNGLSEEVLPLLDQVLEIPQYGTKHSLNVSVCGGIVLWHFTRKFLE